MNSLPSPRRSLPSPQRRARYRAHSVQTHGVPGARRTCRQPARPSPPRPPNVSFGVVASACLMRGVYRGDEPYSAVNLGQTLEQGALAGGGGSPFGGARWSPGPAFGAVARAQPMQYANSPKVGAGACPVFEPSEADIAWVRERVWGGGGGPPAEGAHRDPDPSAMAGAHSADRPKFGAGLSAGACPVFEPPEADIEWVRKRMWGGSARARRLGTPHRPPAPAPPTRTSAATRPSASYST